jgi:DNA-directed RNA polymerase specialized sigma24 family protein
VKYVILIHSNPQPWGHPTPDFLPEYQGLPEDVRGRLMKDFEEVLGELQVNGELVGGVALGDPASSTLYRWRDGTPLAVDGPYSEAKEHLAGFFLIDVENRQSGRGDRREVLRARGDRRASAGDGLRRPRSVTVLADVWRHEAPHVLAALLRRCGDLGDCEDAAQDAAEAATAQWPVDGVPSDPRAWLIRVASRRLIDRFRADRARTRREEHEACRQGVDAPAADEVVTGGAAPDGDPGGDDTLRLLILCCHPALSRPSQVALSLRAVAGLTVEQIAAARPRRGGRRAGAHAAHPRALPRPDRRVRRPRTAGRAGPRPVAPRAGGRGRRPAGDDVAARARGPLPTPGRDRRCAHRVGDL